MKPRTRSRTPSSIASKQLSKSMMSAATAAVFVVTLVMAWSPFQRSNAGITWVQHPGDYANQIPTTPATAPKQLDAFSLANREEANYVQIHQTYFVQSQWSAVLHLRFQCFYVLPLHSANKSYRPAGPNRIFLDP